jgi:hypothetical protein
MIINNNFFVLDVNFLRNPELNQLLKSAEEEFFVITENVIVETMKSKDWDYIYKKNFAIICQYPEKIYVTSPIGNLLEYERQNKKACTDIFNEGSTNAIRIILNEMKNNNFENIDTLIGENISTTQQYVHSELLDYTKIKDAWLTIHSDFMESSGTKLREKLRKKRLATNQLYDLTIEAVDEIFCNEKKFFGDSFSKEEIDNFKEQNSLFYKLFATWVYNSFWWQMKKGLENMDEKKITNEQFDIDNILIALYGKGIFSVESYVNALFGHIKNVLAIKFKNL